MGQVLIRNIDDEVLSSLRYKAKMKGRPLEQELREILITAAPFTIEERIVASEMLRASLPADGFDVSAAIRAGRDDEHDLIAKNGRH